MNSDNSEHCFYIVCKCLSSIIYYDFYMHKVDFLFISKLIVNQSKSMYLSQVSSCLSPKILYLPLKSYIKTFEINIKIYILVACFIVFIQSRVFNEFEAIQRTLLQTFFRRRHSQCLYRSQGAPIEGGINQKLQNIFWNSSRRFI